jgi:hypothetical protein
MADLVGVYSQSAIQEMDAGKLLMSITQSCSDYGLQVPAELTLVAKALLNLLVVAALVFGSSIIAQVGESWNGWRLLGYPGIAVTGFFLASALGVYLAALALIPARRHTVGDPASRPRPDGE